MTLDGLRQLLGGENTASDNSDGQSTMRRRGFLGAMGATAVGGSAGCLDRSSLNGSNPGGNSTSTPGGTGTPTGTPTDTDTPTSTPVPAKKFEDIYQDVVDNTDRTVKNRLEGLNVTLNSHTLSEDVEKIWAEATRTASRVDFEAGSEAARYALFTAGIGPDQVIVDNRTGYSGAEGEITAIYVNEGTIENPEWHKDLAIPKGNITDERDYLRHNETPQSNTEQNIKGMWYEENAGHPLNLDGIKARIERIGREEFTDDQWETNWNMYWRGFNHLILGKEFDESGVEYTDPEEMTLAPTEDAWEYFHELETITRDAHSEAVNAWRNVNLEAHNREIGSDEYLQIDYNGSSLEFEIINKNEYNPTEVIDI